MKKISSTSWFGCLSVLLLCMVNGQTLAPAQQSSRIEKDGVVRFSQMKKRSPQYDYDPPLPGSYELVDFGLAADGRVVGLNGREVSFHDLIEDKVCVLSFIYSRCSNPMACPMATKTLSELQFLTREFPNIVDETVLVSLSFDPLHDKPEVMSRYSTVSVGSGKGALWHFLTTRSEEELKPILDAYGQRVDSRKQAFPGNEFYHTVRVYLIDKNKHIRNIYSHGLMDARLIMTDILTLKEPSEGQD